MRLQPEEVKDEGESLTKIAAEDGNKRFDAQASGKILGVGTLTVPVGTNLALKKILCSDPSPERWIDTEAWRTRLRYHCRI